MTVVTRRERAWLWVCLLSLLGYLLHSEAVRCFGHEAARLLGKL